MGKTLCELKYDLKYHEGYIKGLQEAFKMFEKVIKKVLDGKKGKIYDVRHDRESSGIGIL